MDVFFSFFLSNVMNRFITDFNTLGFFFIVVSYYNVQAKIVYFCSSKLPDHFLKLVIKDCHVIHFTYVFTFTGYDYKMNCIKKIPILIEIKHHLFTLNL